MKLVGIGVAGFTPTCGPTSIPMIVPLWADVDTRIGGTVNYRETTQPQILSKATADIQRAFPGINIILDWAFVATWDNVGFHGANGNCAGNTKRNTFQTILASSQDSQSFVIMLYNSVTWTSSAASRGNCTGLGGTVSAKAGFDFGDSFTFFDIGGSCSDTIVNLPSTTNVGQPGKWVFRVDHDLQATGCGNRLQNPLEQIDVTPSFVPIFGNIPITMEGPCLAGASRVQVRFNDVRPTTVNATVSSDNSATCVLPYLYHNGRISLDLLVTRVGGTVQTFRGFIYTKPQNSEIEFRLVNETTFEMSWNAGNFESGSKLDLELLELAGGVWTSRGIVKGNLSNTGHFSGHFSDEGASAIEKLSNIFVVKLQVDPGVILVSMDHPLISRTINELGRRTQAQISALCNSWYIRDAGPPNDAQPCPRTLQQAQADDRFQPVQALEPYNPEAEFGFEQSVPSDSGAGQRCVYRNGVLLVGPTSGGSVQKVSPNGPEGEIPHIEADLTAWFTCCYVSTDPLDCLKYYLRRPSDDGSNYVPPGPGSGIGDPHITSLDGHFFTFNGIGEFHFIKSDDGSFSMQGRTAQYITPDGVRTAASVCKSYVMQQRKCKVIVTVQLTITTTKIELLLDGIAVAYGTEFPYTIKHNGASITITSLLQITVTFELGYSFRFTHDRVHQVLNMVTMVAVENREKFKGLLGPFDGNINNDFTRPDGTIMPITSTYQQIHEYGMLWQINGSESLFTYPIGKSYESFRDPDFVPNFELPDLDRIPPEIVEMCRGSIECLFDWFVTGSTEFAAGSRDDAERFNDIVDSQAVACRRPATPVSGRLEVDNFLEGSTATLVCERNFHEIVGNGTITCVRDGSGALRWNRKMGECVSKCKNDDPWEEFLCEIEFGRIAK